MAIVDEDNHPKRPAGPGAEDLAALSEAELADRIAMLKREIDRTETALEAKRASRNAAAAFFKG